MQIRARKLTRIKLVFLSALICAAQMAQAEPSLRLTSNVIWSQSEPWFGGFSGAEVSANGQAITLVTDKGSLVTATMIRENGKLSAMQLRSHAPLTHANGALLRNKRTDAEGLAIDAQGRAFVSFEHRHRVVQIDLKSARTLGGIPNPDFASLQPNAGLEALAVDANGTLFTLPELTGNADTPFPIFTLTNNEWKIAHHIPRSGPFLPVGADFGDDGLFYLLERAITPLGFRSRIRRFNLTAPDLGEETLITTGPGRFDNLEALSIWRNKAGQTYLTLISDDNFMAIQRTQIVEFILTE